ncbi:hypothetical protein WJX84_009523 [Apatococcus fuscideae]|uniref:Uncharacterized protein n=1 Tax=Apatococcus fuscideae TaxID=2026836 RepID=A0AAW1TDR0_9CHLO
MSQQTKSRKKQRTQTAWHQQTKALPAPKQESTHARAVEVLTASDILQPDKGPLKRPAKRESKAPQQPAAERLEKDIVSGRTWHGECQALNYDLPDTIPETFANLEEYIRTFEPPLFEEAREQIRSPWADAAESMLGFSADITRVGECNGGWHQVTIRVDDQAGAKLDNDRRFLSAGSLLVLTRRRPPNRMGALDWLLRGGLSAREKRSADKIAKAAAAPERGPGSEVQQQAAPDSLGAVVAQQEHSQLPVIVGLVQDRKVRNGLELNEVPLAIHPACAAHRDTPNSCCKQVLQVMRQDPEKWHGIYLSQPITSQRELNALHRLQYCEIKDEILQPHLLKEAAKKLSPEQRQRMWPPEIGQQYHGYLQHEFDFTQLSAIEAAACHLGAHEDQAHTVPIVMIQGPPGTGKTHTVKGMLNIWHLVQFQRYYATLVRELISSRGHLEHHAFTRSIPNLAAKPRLLVCTPSNAAADELLERVMDPGLFQVKDGRGGFYKPNVVRAASTEAGISVRAQAVAVEHMSDAWINLSKPEWEHRKAIALQIVSNDTELSRALHAELAKYPTQEEKVAKAGTLVDVHQRRDKALVELERLEEVWPKIFAEPGRFINIKQMRDNLEASLMQEAEMVFCTLSSTGRRSFGQMIGKFETVLVDEVAQATEVATLQALCRGCKRAVFVGDPQQLPATVLSQEAKHLQLERSLFQRLQAGGAAVVMLAVQYRMHPQIREFPSAHFYDNRLVDGANVQQAAAAGELFYEHQLLQPYRFFDVASGKDERRGSGSIANSAEADMAAALFWELRNFLKKAVQAGKRPNGVRVGVIAFYKAQVALLRETFQRLEVASEEPGLAHEVQIETVDSFQGKQLDVVILSCVRARDAAIVPTHGVGFVADVRRLNVAITRAKKAMWILGNAATLERSPVWSALITDARERQAVVPHASSAKLFPDCPLNAIPSGLPPFGMFAAGSSSRYCSRPEDNKRTKDGSLPLPQGFLMQHQANLHMMTLAATNHWASNLYVTALGGKNLAS